MDKYTITINTKEAEGETEKIIASVGTIGNVPIKSIKVYSDLTAKQKAIYDSFIAMIKTFQ